MTDEYEPLPDAIIIELPKRVALMLWAIATAEDRTIEYVAARWLEKTAAGEEAVFKAMETLGKTRQARVDLGIDVRKERLAMTPTMRLTVMKRDKFKCVYCGSGKEKKLHVDHIVPVIRGGKTVIENLQVLCVECNLAKAAGPDAKSNVVEFPEGASGRAGK